VRVRECVWLCVCRGSWVCGCVCVDLGVFGVVCVGLSMCVWRVGVCVCLCDL